jgi:hypothetical protein
VYFWFVSNQGGLSMTFERYQLAIWPALSIWFGIGVIFLRDLIAGPKGSVALRRAVLAVLLSVLSVPAYHAYATDRDMRGLRAAKETGDWIAGHVKNGERVVFGAVDVQLPPKITCEFPSRVMAEPLEAYQKRGVVYFVVSSSETDDYFGPNKKDSDHPDEINTYHRMLAATTLVATFGGPGETTYTILKMK